MQVPTQRIATSSAQFDSGIFALQFNDERYIPFEGAGVISTWSIELPKQYRQCDYSAISDAIFRMKYTSKYGGETLKEKGITSIGQILKGTEGHKSQLGIDVSNKFSSECYRFTASIREPQSMELTGLRNMLPYLALYMGIDIVRVHMYTIRKGDDLQAQIRDLQPGQVCFILVEL
ncbi:hypothetical protein TWF694_010111 [Orbilia ellipsospora]|uniref:Tc toxin complex TcA C-terminal TcB-binding domain-containing protein n=1 Tax=Orbilia ellipsospora TaxID=2528407 RepID=A0AAV9X8Z3_9PEZI